MQPVNTPRVFSERYELTHQVARGGMAQVYRARDRLLDRPVALKVLFPELSVDQAFVERFRREAMAAANLSHPNIVPVFDWGEDTGTYFIVMEFVDGSPLSAVLRNSGPLPPTRVAEIATGVADALSYAHRHGVVHRDVKPGNVLITDDGQVKVTDFGIARAINTEDSLTQTGAVMGTATYFSPEQAEGIGVDARSDIYSLGVVMFEMVAGRPPFLGETPVSIASKHVRDRPPLLRDLNPAVPPALEAVIAKAMAKSADLRYQTAADLKADLVHFLQGRPVTAGDALATAAMAGAATGVMGAVDATQAVYPGDGAMARAAEARAAEAAARRARTRRLWLLLGLLFVVLLVVLAILGKQLGWYGSSSLPMPDVVGKTQAAAVQTLKTDGLTVAGTSAKQSTKPSGVVLATSPGAGTTVTKGDKVTLTVSSGPKKVAVATVKGRQVVTAEKSLQRQTLRYRVNTVSSTKPNGEVLGQSPAGGTTVKVGTTITLTVSAQSTVTVPTVVGKPPSQAGAELGGAGLTVGKTTTACSNTVGSGLVSATTPPASKQVAPKTLIDLTVSSGPCTTPVPNVVGQTQSAAQSTLSSHGFTNVTAATTASCDPATNGKVVSQSPTGGTSVPATNGVTITVCTATATSSTTTTTTTTTTTPTPTPR